jgi:hypothetical protein
MQHLLPASDAHEGPAMDCSSGDGNQALGLNGMSG